MSDLIVFLDETFDVTIKKMIEKLRACSFEKRYQTQTIILDRIIQSNIVLEKKTTIF